MISQIPLDRFSENLETRNVMWISPDGQRSTTEVIHIKTQRHFTQIEVLSKVENEYLDAMNNLEKYLSAEKSSVSSSSSNKSASTSFTSSAHSMPGLLRLHMYSTDLLVTATLQKQYKMLFLVDSFSADLRSYLEKHKAEGTVFTPKNVFNLFHQIADSVACAYNIKCSEKKLEISRVHMNNFVVNYAFNDAIKFIHNPSLAVFDTNTYSSGDNSNKSQKVKSNRHILSGTSPSNTNGSSNGSGKSMTPQVYNNSSSSFSSMMSHYSTTTNKLSSQSSLKSYSSQSSRGFSPSSSNSGSSSQQKKECSVQQNLEMIMIKDMGELFVRIATQSTEEWVPKDPVSEDASSAWAAKMKKGIRQVQIKFSQQLGSLISQMISADQSERPPLKKIQQVLSSIEADMSSKQLEAFNSQKQVKFQPQAQIPMTPVNGIRAINIQDMNNKSNKNKLISILPINEQGIVLIDLNDPKHSYIERIDFDNTTNKEEVMLMNQVNLEGCRCANVLLSNEYEVYTFGGYKSLRTSKFLRFTNELQSKATMIGKYSRHSFGICVVVTDIFIIGGCDGESTTGACEKYDTQTNAWRRVAPMNVAVRDAAVCAFNNSSIYKFGGVESDGTVCQVIEKYEIASDTWIVAKYAIQPALKISFELLTNSLAVQVNEMQILVIGGQRGTKDHHTQPKQIFVFNILSGSDSFSYNHGTSYEVSDLNSLGILPETTQVYADQVTVFNNEVLFLQMRNKANAAKLLSFSSPGGIKVLRSDLKW